jgi:hypothetical protein
MPWSWSRLRFGAFRYQSSLKAATVARLSNRGGKTSGADSRTEAE